MENNDNSINYSFKDSLVSSFYFFLIASVLLSLLKWDVLGGVFIALVLALLVLPFVYIGEVLGRKKHKKLIESSLYSDLQRAGFKVEKLGNYRGLIGERKKCCCRIYYEWCGLAKGFLSFGDMVLVVYYKSLLNEEELKDESIIDDERYDDIYGTLIKLSNSEGMFSKSKNIEYTPCFVQRNINYFYWIKSEKILRKLDDLIKEVEENKFLPEPLEEVKERENKHADYYYPKNDFLVDYIEKKKKASDFI